MDNVTETLTFLEWKYIAPESYAEAKSKEAISYFGVDFTKVIGCVKIQPIQVVNDLIRNIDVPRNEGI